MRKRLSSAGSVGNSGMKLNKIGLSSLAIAAVSVAAVGVGANMLASSQKDTSATNGDIVSLEDSMTINPVYEEYLADVAAGKGSEWEIIPNKYIPSKTNRNLRFYNAEESTNSNLPTSYNLVNEGYGTKIKNQGTDGICWAFATTSAIESHLLRDGISNIELSPKQMDYLYASGTTHGDYVKSTFDTERSLGDGYNFVLASLGFSSGLTPVKESDFFPRMQANDSMLAGYESWNNYSDIQRINLFLTGDGTAYTKEMPYSQVTKSQSDYIVTEFTDYAPEDISLVKQSVYNDGAAFVGTVSPGVEGCYDEETNTIVDRGSVICGGSNGHAMTVVGWDDNHSYTDPATGATKTGAFILQNSWGKSSLLSDYGVTYDSLVEKDILDASQLSEEDIQSIKSIIADYDALETVYLSYQFDSDNIMTDFGLIEKVEANEYDNIYNVTMGENFKGASMGDAVNEVVYTYTTDSGAQYIDSVAVASNFIAYPEALNYIISIDTGGGYKELGSVEIPADTIGAQRVLKLQQPIKVSGIFNLKFAVQLEPSVIVDASPVYKYFTMTAFAKNDGNSSTPSDNQSSGKITWIQGQNYEIGSNEDLIVKVDYPLSSLVEVDLDGKALTAGDFKVESGSTILTIYGTFLDTLEAGAHTIQLLYSDKTIEISFTVVDGEDVQVPNTSAAEEPTSTTAPETGKNTNSSDANSAILSYALPILIAASALGYFAYRRKKQIRFFCE